MLRPPRRFSGRLRPSQNSLRQEARPARGIARQADGRTNALKAAFSAGTRSQNHKGPDHHPSM